MADTLTGFVDQLSDPASSFSTLASTSSSFRSLADFSASSTSEALKWTDLVVDLVYQHGPSLQKADGSCCSAWACGMLTQNPMAMVTSPLFIRPQG